MDLLTAAAILLILRIVAISIISYIIITITFPNLKAENDLEVRPVRWVLFAFSIILFLGNLIPIIVDVGTLFSAIERSTERLSTAGALYSFNNAIMSVFFSLGFWLLFVVSGQANVKLKAANKRLQDDNDELHREIDS